MNRFKAFFQSKRAKMLTMATAIMASLSVFCFAAEGDVVVPDISSVMTSSINKVITDGMTTIANMLPGLLSLVGLGLTVGFGIKWFKKITSKA